MNEEKTVVTALVKYDLFPYYTVVKGELRGDGGVAVKGIGSWSPNLILRILPAPCYEEQESLRLRIADDYRKLSEQLRVDLLTEAGVYFK